MAPEGTVIGIGHGSVGLRSSCQDSYLTFVEVCDVRVPIGRCTCADRTRYQRGYPLTSSRLYVKLLNGALRLRAPSSWTSVCYANMIEDVGRCDDCGSSCCPGRACGLCRHFPALSAE